MRRWSRAALLACASLLIPSAGAHAFLERASPAVGSTVHSSPTQVKLWFSQRLEAAFSTLHVFDASGNEVKAGSTVVDAADAATMSSSLPGLAPGTYRVKWRVLSVDSHVTEGEFTFQVTP